MVADDDEPSAGTQQLWSTLQCLLERGELVVDRNAQGLEYAC
jgi:hypothetical protein